MSGKTWKNNHQPGVCWEEAHCEVCGRRAKWKEPEEGQCRVCEEDRVCDMERGKEGLGHPGPQKELRPALRTMGSREECSSQGGIELCSLSPSPSPRPSREETAVQGLIKLEQMWWK